MDGGRAVRFNDYVTIKPRSCRGTTEDYIRELMMVPAGAHARDHVDCWRSSIEMGWIGCERPFYNVYPIAVELCLKTSLSMKWGDILFPKRYLCLRFAEGHEPLGIKSSVLRVPSEADQSTPINVHYTRLRYVSEIKKSPLASCMATKGYSDGVIFWNYPNAEIRNEVVGVTSGMKWTESADHDVHDVEETREQAQFLIRLLAFIGLLARGTDLITPAILAADREEYDATSDEARKRWLENRAAKRQGQGFDVGRNLEIERESSPHWRSPHLALFHTGPGRTVPVLKVRSGCVVVPNDMSKVPTGFLGSESPDEQAEENSTRYRSSISPKTRFEVLRRDKYTCRLCGMTTADGIKLQVDHIIPKAKGGTDDMANLQTTCQPCNSGKSASDLYLPEPICEEASAIHQPGVVA